MTTTPIPRSSLTGHRLPRWVVAVSGAYVILAAGSAVIAAFDPALLVNAHAQINDAAHVYAGYLISRNTAIAIVLAGSLVARRGGALAAGLAFAALTQLLDVVVDAITGRWILLPGLLLLTGVLATAAWRLTAERGPGLPRMRGLALHPPTTD